MADMNRAFFLRKEDRAPQWHVIDAKGKTLGRLATHIADMLRGKDRPTFTAHTDSGDYVVVINAEHVHVTGKKEKGKIYRSYSGWMSGLKEKSLWEVRQQKPTEIIRLAVKGMLPKNRLSRQIMGKLKIYAGEQHPHQAQV